MTWKGLILSTVTSIAAGTAGILIWDGHYAKSPQTSQNMPIGPEQAQAFLLSTINPDYLPIRDFNISEPVLTASAAGVYDVESDKFLYAKNIHQNLPIASITKLMTAITVLDNLDLNNIVTVPVEDINADGLGGDFKPDEQFYGKELFKIMLVKSSNDAALAFATEASKHGTNLIQKMNEKAVEFGMTETHFSDPTGLDDANAFSTVGDLVKLVRHVSEYPLIWSTLLLPSADVVSIDGIHYHHVINTNKLLGVIPDIIGGKTGFTDKAGKTMVLEVGVNNNKNHLISVVLGSQDRFGEIRELINWSEKAYTWK